MGKNANGPIFILGWNMIQTTEIRPQQHIMHTSFIRKVDLQNIAFVLYIFTDINILVHAIKIAFIGFVYSSYTYKRIQNSPL